MVDVKEAGQLVGVKVSSSYVEMYVCRTPVVVVVVCSVPALFDHFLEVEPCTQVQTFKQTVILFLHRKEHLPKLSLPT